MNLNGKKNKLKKNDFYLAMKGAGLDSKVIENIFKKYKNILPKWISFIDQSFLPNETKEEYKKLIKKKSEQIEL